MFIVFAYHVSVIIAAPAFIAFAYHVSGVTAAFVFIVFAYHVSAVMLHLCSFSLQIILVL